MRRLVALAGIAIATLPVPARSASVPILVVDGRGFGHGVGMAQDGAYWMGAAGARTEQILGQFYPGTSIGKGSGPVRVAVGDVGPAPTAVVLAFPDGGEIRDARSGDQSPGFPIAVPKGGAVRVVHDNGRYRVEGPTDGTVAIGRPRLASHAGHTRQQIDLPTTTSTTQPPDTTTSTSTSTTQPPGTTTSTSTTTPAPSLVPSTTTSTTEQPPDSTTTSMPAARQDPSTTRTIWAVPAGNGTVDLTYRQRRYRGLLEVTGAAGTLRVVNEVDVETYLKGMGEVRDPRWPPAALRAQAIAARTYALRAMLLGGGELCDTQRCQVYLGAQAEYGAMNKAVDDTRGQVIAYGRQLASAVYSANGGGFSASREEGFGIPAGDNSAPYLRPAPYATQDPSPWSVAVALDTVAARLGYRGTITNVTISRVGPSGRALEVLLDGTAGPKPVQGIAFDAALGLKSTLFTVRLDTADVAPEVPPAEQLIQAPPEEAAVQAAPVAEEAPVERASRSRALERIEIDPSSPPSTGDTSDEIALTFASWATLAAIGAASLALNAKRPRLSAGPLATASSD